MNRIRFGILLWVVLLVAVALVAEAHHASVMFDSTKEITLEGTMKEFQYTNPHSWLLVDVTNKDGSVTTWGFEAEGPSTLMPRKILRAPVDSDNLKRRCGPGPDPGPMATHV